MIREILVLHHSHFDYGYTHPQPAIAELTARFIDEALDLADATADLPPGERFCWTCETTGQLRLWLDRASPAARARLRAAASRRQLSCGALAFHGTPLLGLDDFRLALADARQLREECGVACRAAVQHDVNGIAWPAAGLLHEAGVEALLLGLNITMGALTFGRRHVLFRWRGPDGRELTAFHGDHYNTFGRLFRMTAPGDRLRGDLWPAYERQLCEDWGWPHDWALLTVTMNRFPDNNPPDPHLVEVLRDWNVRGEGPRVRLVSLEDVVERFRSIDPASLPVFAGDWSDYWAFGVGSSARETAVNRRAKSRLRAAALAGLPNGAPDRPVLAQARASALWWDEHTWGGYHTVEGEANDTVAMQWHGKAAFAWRAAGLAELALRDELDALAGNAPTGTRPEGVLFYNPAPVPAAWARPLIQRLVTGEYVHSHGRSTSLDAPLHTLRGTETDAAGSASWVQGDPLPPQGWRIVPIPEALAGKLPAPETGPGWIGNAWLRLHFDPATGSVLRLQRADTGRELLAEEPVFGFAQPVHETPAGLDSLSARPPLAGRDAFWQLDYDRIHANQTTWRPDWEAVRTGAVPESAEVVNRPGSSTLVTRWRLPGCGRCVTRLTLHGHRPGIDVELELDLHDQRLPEGIYLAFPLRLAAGWRAWADAADVPFEIDAEQLPGTGRDFIAAGSWIALRDDSAAVQLCCPDAPLVSPDGFHFGRLRAAIDRPADPLLLGWPLNNYWYTNFRISQPGPVNVRYRLFFDDTLDLARCARRALAAGHEVEIHPVLRLPPADRRAGQVCAVTGDLVLLHAGAAAGGACLTLLNPRDERAGGEVALPHGTWGPARLVDVLGRDLADDTVHLTPRPHGCTLSLPARRAVRVMLTRAPGS